MPALRSLRAAPPAVALGFVAFACATLGAQESAPHGAEFLLDRLETASAHSLLLDAPPLEPVRLDLDACTPAALLNGGARRLFVLEVPLAVDRRGRPVAAQLRVGAAAAGEGVRLVPFAARQELELVRQPGFAGFARHLVNEGEPAVVVERPIDIEVSVPRCGVALHGELVHRWFSTGGDGGRAGRSTPQLRLLDGTAELGSVELGRGAALPFELPPSASTTKLRIVASGFGEAAGGARARLLLQSLRLVAVDGRDRAVVVAPPELRGLRLDYAAAVPPPRETLFEPVEPAPREVALDRFLLRGEALLVADPPQPLELRLEGAAVGGVAHAESGADGIETRFAVAQEGVARLVVRGRDGPLRGRITLLQPRALWCTLANPRESLAVATPPVRGLESADGSPLLRHVMIGDETRRALLLPPPASIECAFEARAGDRLEFGVGLAELLPEPLCAALELALELRAADGAVTPLFTTTLAEAGPWQQRTVVLPDGARGPLRLRFTTRVAGAVRGAGGAADEALRGCTRLVAVSEPTLRRAARDRRPNLLIYLVDTLRADHCTPYRADRDTTPQLARLAADGIAFANAFSQAPWTRPSVATLLTSRLFSVHGAGVHQSLAPELPTLAEQLHAAGYATAAFVANAHVCGDSLNFEQGFSRFTAVELGRKKGQARADAVNRAALEWVRGHADRPFFLYAHTIDPHAPYDPPRSTAGRWSSGYAGPLAAGGLNAHALARRAPLSAADLAHVMDRYDEEIAFNDAAFGELCDELRRLGVYDDTLIVFLSDHGEEFFEHGGFGHGGRLWEEQLHVPLVVKLDRRNGEQPLAGARIAEPVRTLDLLPTLLARLRIDAAAARWMGSDVGACFAGLPAPELDVIAQEQGPSLASLRAGRFKLIRGEATGEVPAWSKLFDLADDPREQRDLAGERPEIVLRLGQRLQAQLDEWEAAGFTRVESTAQRLDADTRAALRALGYLEGEADDSR